jgi:hypothetical protein
MSGWKTCFSSIEKSDWIGLLFVTSILLCDSEVKKLELERREDVFRTETEQK